MFVDAPFRARGCAALLMAIVLLPSLAAAQRGARGGGGPQQAQPVGEPRFEYVGPSGAGRIAAAAAVAGKPGVYCFRSPAQATAKRDTQMPGARRGCFRRLM